MVVLTQTSAGPSRGVYKMKCFCTKCIAEGADRTLCALAGRHLLAGAGGGELPLHAALPFMLTHRLHALQFYADSPLLAAGAQEQSVKPSS